MTFYNLSVLCNKHQVVSHICNNEGKKFSKQLASDVFIARLFFKIFSNFAPKGCFFFNVLYAGVPANVIEKNSKYWKHHFPHKNQLKMYVWQIKVPANEKLSKLSRHSTRKSNSKCVITATGNSIWSLTRRGRSCTALLSIKGKSLKKIARGLFLGVFYWPLCVTNIKLVLNHGKRVSEFLSMSLLKVEDIRSGSTTTEMNRLHSVE